MPCYSPNRAYHRVGGGITFNPNESFGKKFQFDLPCRQCLGCRLEHAKQWALRCYHETQMHKISCFITLTYNNENLPDHGNLDKEHFPKFIRALRQKTKQKLRYYMCGEYGDDKNRPHYHAILFGYQFPDLKFRKLRNKNRVYTSQLADETWGRGTCELGSATFQSAGYVARYILKKQRTADEDQLRYCIYNENTGEFHGLRLFEFTQMSLKPGIGESWYRAFKTDIFPHDYAVLPDGRQTSVPAYYRRLLRREDPDLYEKLRTLRIEKSKSNPDNSPERLATISKCQTQKQSRMTRSLES